jgi:hypothetical protein
MGLTVYVHHTIFSLLYINGRARALLVSSHSAPCFAARCSCHYTVRLVPARFQIPSIITSGTGDLDGKVWRGMLGRNDPVTTTFVSRFVYKIGCQQREQWWPAEFVWNAFLWTHKSMLSLELFFGWMLRIAWLIGKLITQCIGYEWFLYRILRM